MGNDWPPDKSEHVKATKGEFAGYEEDIHLWIIKDGKKEVACVIPRRPSAIKS